MSYTSHKFIRLKDIEVELTTLFGYGTSVPNQCESLTTKQCKQNTQCSSSSTSVDDNSWLSRLYKLYTTRTINFNNNNSLIQNHTYCRSEMKLYENGENVE